MQNPIFSASYNSKIKYNTNKKLYKQNTVCNNVTILKFLWKKVNKVADREGTCRGLCKSCH